MLPFGRKINEPFHLENASNLTRKKLVCKIKSFSRRNDSFIFPPKGGAKKGKC